MKLTTKLAKIKLDNPTILASGVLGVTAAALNRASKSGAGAVTTKSIGPQRREGHDNPVVVELDCGLLNAVGLSCPGPEESLRELTKAVKSIDKPVIASFYGKSILEFGHMAEFISKAKPDFIEANISCPNVGEFGLPFGCSAKTAGKITKAVKNSTDIPLIVKLTPNVVDIRAIAIEVEKNGADVICAINTVGPGMKIDVTSGYPILSNKTGGLSGECIKPIAVRCVYEISESVDIPVIGVGGVSSGIDAVEMLMAGAAAVGVGTAVWHHGVDVFQKITGELMDFMSENNYSSLDEIIGRSHG
ncbi:MAG: dihydroorotate dehydrogenase B catalytic subunit [Candidatus Altiarchaeales archaeon ex4484_96]|nr:MAG: dihydroorotate dehydrogenase B catalytic subunit [Candidatus Altiarchaeales archaeon ex4484_96]